MKIVVDAYGGDNAPLEIIKGCKLAADEFSVDIVLTGKKDELENILRSHGISHEHIEIENADDILTMDDNPTSILKSKRGSSMGVAFDMLKDGRCDAFVSAGSTGAVLVGATMIVRRIKGVKRAALATVFPTEKSPLMLTDIGANTVCTPDYLVQFALMGSEYMKFMHGVDNPRIGLLNNGTEEHKGQELHQEVYKLLSDSELNFIGNIEGREIALGGCDVAVADGFSGNIALKTYEGSGKMMSKEIKDIFNKNIITKIGALFVLKELKDFKKKFDYKEYGGAPLLGISKPVIKAHGSSDAKAIKNAIRQAIAFQNSGMIDVIAEKLKTKTE